MECFAKEHDLIFYDTPIQRTKAPAEQGQLMVLDSRPLSHRSFVQPLFDAIAKKVICVDEKAGASSRLKLALNSYVLALTHGIAESLKLVKALEIDPKFMIEAVTGGPMDNGYFQGKSAAILNGNYEPSFTVLNALKDAQLVAQAANKDGLELDLIAAGIRRFERVIANDHGDKDMVASYLA